MADRRRRVLVLGGALVVLPALAQPRRVPVVGYMSPFVPQNDTDARFEAFRQGLRELGYVEGRDVRLEVRWAGGRLDRLPAIAAELVRLKVDVIVAATSPSVLAARQATRAIPIVMPVISDPVAEGIVESLARPGGNVTGLSVMAPELG
jgi:putative ABC transport system substrate-binding protein